MKVRAPFLKNAASKRTGIIGMSSKGQRPLSQLCKRTCNNNNNAIQSGDFCVQKRYSCILFTHTQYGQHGTCVSEQQLKQCFHQFPVTLVSSCQNMECIFQFQTRFQVVDTGKLLNDFNSIFELMFQQLWYYFSCSDKSIASLESTILTIFQQFIF